MKTYTGFVFAEVELTVEGVEASTSVEAEQLVRDAATKRIEGDGGGPMVRTLQVRHLATTSIQGQTRPADDPAP